MFVFNVSFLFFFSHYSLNLMRFGMGIMKKMGSNLKSFIREFANFLFFFFFIPPSLT